MRLIYKVAILFSIISTVDWYRELHLVIFSLISSLPFINLDFHNNESRLQCDTSN
jgi:hypothetical protein